jgi:hypothetical protein
MRAPHTANFPRSTINGTLEDFRLLLLAPVLTKSKKISPEVYRALSLDTSSGAISTSDKATAPKRIATFLQLCANFIPCDHSAYDQAVFSLDAEVDMDVERAKAVLALVEEQHCLPSTSCKMRPCQSSSRSCMPFIKVAYNSLWETTRLA